MANPVTSGLVLQLDPSTLALSDGSAVTSWSDSSGNGNTATVGGGGSSPIYKANIFGSNPAVRFQGGTNGLTGPLTGWGSGGAGITLILAASGTIYAQFGGFVAVGPSGGNDYDNINGALMENPTSDGGLECYSDNSLLFTTDLSSTTPVGLAKPTDPTVVGLGLSASFARLMVNGGIVCTQALSRSMGNPSNYSIGQLWRSGAMATTFGAKYDCGFALAYNRLLSTAEFASVGLWLAQQLGILPSSGGGSGGVSLARVLGGL